MSDVQTTLLSLDATYSVSVRNLCEFAAKTGDLDLRFKPTPTAKEGREGHQLVASRRAEGHETEVSLCASYRELRIRGRADGYDPSSNVLEEVKTFRGRIEAIAPNHSGLHWAQLKVYGWLMCRDRELERITLALVYFDVMDQTEHPIYEEFDAQELEAFYNTLCDNFLGWARTEMAHRNSRDTALRETEFPQRPFRPGQRDLASGVYRAALRSKTLLVQAPTGIGKTIGVVYPALRAMPERGIDKIFYLTAKTPGRQVALEALERVKGHRHDFPLRLVELVAKDKSCEHRHLVCHGQSCPLASGFYDRLPAARRFAAQTLWLDQAHLRQVALAHNICPYYLGHEMVRWADVVVGDYNYYFDRSAILYALMLEGGWRVSVLVDEAHNLYARACSMYSETLTQAQAIDLRPKIPPPLRGALDGLLSQWQLLLEGSERDQVDAHWKLLAEVPESWLRSMQNFNGVVGEYINERPGEAHGEFLNLYFQTVGFAELAGAFGEHSLCELDRDALAGLLPSASNDTPIVAIEQSSRQLALMQSEPYDDDVAGSLTLRNIVPAPFITKRITAADSLVMFSATLNPADYYINLLGLPQETWILDIPCPFEPEQLRVIVKPISTRRDDRLDSLDDLVVAMANQYTDQPGNYLAFFGSFEYMAMAQRRLEALYPHVRVWVQNREMSESSRHAYLQKFEVESQGIGFAVLGGVFGEGVDLPGRRLIGAFVATLGLPQFDAVNKVICERMQTRFGSGYDYTYLFPGIQKVVQAAGRVIRTQSDTGTVMLLDDRYQEYRYRKLLPAWWRIGIDC